MESLTLNLTARARRVSEGGKDYLVAPMVLINPGVLTGSKGPLLYRTKDISKSVSNWNGMPLVIYHPHDPITNQPLSAQDPTHGPGVLEKQGVGEIRNARMNKNRLVAEGRFDIDRLKRVSPVTHKRLLAGDPVELSTGLFTDNVEQAGSFNGKPYVAVATNFRPDHLAVLPDQLGACSIKDGCGILVNQLVLNRKIQVLNGGPGSGPRPGSRVLVKRAPGSKGETVGTHAKSLGGGYHQIKFDDGSDAEIHQSKITVVSHPTKNQKQTFVINPAWVEDHDIWEKAKAAADRGDYDDDSYYAVVTSIYKKMGGGIAPATKNSASEAVMNKLQQLADNTFCPTGAGGGQDNSCGKGGEDGGEHSDASGPIPMHSIKVPKSGKISIDQATSAMKQMGYEPVKGSEKQASDFSISREYKTPDGRSVRMSTKQVKDAVMTGARNYQEAPKDVADRHAAKHAVKNSLSTELRLLANSNPEGHNQYTGKSSLSPRGVSAVREAKLAEELSKYAEDHSEKHESAATSLRGAASTHRDAAAQAAVRGNQEQVAYHQSEEKRLLNKQNEHLRKAEATGPTNLTKTADAAKVASRQAEKAPSGGAYAAHQSAKNLNTKARDLYKRSGMPKKAAWHDRKVQEHAKELAKLTPPETYGSTEKSHQVFRATQRMRCNSASEAMMNKLHKLIGNALSTKLQLLANEQMRDELGRFASGGGGSKGSGKGSAKVHGAAKEGHTGGLELHPVGSLSSGKVERSPMEQRVWLGKQLRALKSKGASGTVQYKNLKSQHAKIGRSLGFNRGTHDMSSTLQDKLTTLLSNEKSSKQDGELDDTGGRVTELKTTKKDPSKPAAAAPLEDPNALDAESAEDHDLINEDAESPLECPTCGKLKVKPDDEAEEDNEDTQNCTHNESMSVIDDDNQVQQEGGPTMATVTLNAEEREAVVNGLISEDGCCFEESEREVLNSLSDRTLARLTLNAKAMPKFIQDKIDAKAAAEEEEEPEEEEVVGEDEEVENDKLPSAAADGDVKPMGELNPKAKDPPTKNQLSAEDRQFLAIGRKVIADRRGMLINTITANSRNPFDKKELAAMNLDQLEKLGQLARVEERETAPSFTLNRFASYMGAAAGIGNVNGDDGTDDDILPIPTINWKEPAKV